MPLIVLQAAVRGMTYILCKDLIVPAAAGADDDIVPGHDVNAPSSTERTEFTASEVSRSLPRRACTCPRSPAATTYSGMQLTNSRRLLRKAPHVVPHGHFLRGRRDGWPASQYRETYLHRTAVVPAITLCKLYSHLFCLAPNKFPLGFFRQALKLCT